MSTRPPAMTQEEIDRIIKMVESRGASITIQDPRLSRIRDWIATFLGGAILLVLAWVGSTLVDLKQGQAEGKMQAQGMTETLKDHGERLRELERWRYGNERGR